MNLKSVIKQLVRDMKASAGKTAVLGLLLLVGLFFWVPPLLKAFSSVIPAAPPKPDNSMAAASASAATASTNSANSTESAKKPRDSKTLLKMLRDEPLLQPANAEEMPQRPFGLNDDLLPLPVEIAEDELADPLRQAQKVVAKPIEKLDGLVLKSTLVGPTRRVAIINNQLFREGQSVSWNDRQLRLESVNRKTITLTDGSQSWRLTLKDSQSSSED